MKKPSIHQIGAEEAAPFVLAYLREYNLPEIGTLSPAVSWWAARVDGQYEAVMGLADLDGHMFIYGLYANKGFSGVRAARALIEIIVKLPHEEVIGYTINENFRMLKAAEKFGFEKQHNDGKATRLVKNGRK